MHEYKLLIIMNQSDNNYFFKDSDYKKENNKSYEQEKLPQSLQQHANVGSRSLSSGIATGGSTGDRGTTFNPILHPTHSQKNYIPSYKTGTTITTSETNSLSFSSMGSGTVVRLPYLTNTRLINHDNGERTNEVTFL